MSAYQGSYASIFAAEHTRQQHQDARKEAARELIATALFCIDRDCPYAAAAKLEDAAGLLRFPAASRELSPIPVVDATRAPSPARS